MSDEADEIQAVRALFARETHGALCTAHAWSSAWPYGSMVPFAMLDNGDAAIFVSDIAEHTRNLLADPRATLLVRDPLPPNDGRPHKAWGLMYLQLAFAPVGAAILLAHV